MENLSLKLIKILYLRFAVIYGEKFVKNHPTEQIIEAWWEDWLEGMAGIDACHVKEALQYCRLNLSWPPSIAEFRELCERSAGIPTVDEALQLAIRRDFQHPLVALAFDKIGSWAMSNDKEKELRIKFKAAYEEALNQFRRNNAVKQLEDSNQKVALSLVHSK